MKARNFNRKQEISKNFKQGFREIKIKDKSEILEPEPPVQVSIQSLVMARKVGISKKFKQSVNK